MKGLRALLGRVIRRSFPLSALYYVWDDARQQRRFRRGDIATDSGTLHGELNLGASLAYLQEVYADYLHYAGCIRLGARVAEVGPGDNCGVGLLIRAGGAESVDLVDRFYSRRDPGRQAAIYRELAQSNPAVGEFLAGLDLEDEEVFPGVRRHYGEEASAERFFRAGQDYDAILSRAVLEHVQDPLLSLRRMTEALRPGGLLLHKVDLRDHGMFSPQHGELKWLEVPEGILRRMTRGSGRPNRVLLPAYRRQLAELALESQVLVTSLAAVGEITPHLPYDEIPLPLRRRSMEAVAAIRPRLARRLRGEPLEDLSVTGFFLVARKRES